MSPSRGACLAVAFGLAAGCNGGASDPSPVAPKTADTADRLRAKLRDFKDRTCACASAACLDDVERERAAWVTANSQIDELLPSLAWDAEAERIEDEREGCKARYGFVPPAISPPPSGVVMTQFLPGRAAPACDAYMRLFDDVLGACHVQLGPALDDFVRRRNAAVEAFAQWGTLDATSRESAARGCTSAADVLRQTATAIGCPR